MSKIEILDTTLRDGSQGQGIVFSVSDKLAVVQALDELGLTWIEAGNPGSNPKDMEFFRQIKSLKLTNSQICAFGTTRKKGIKPQDDNLLQNLLVAGAETLVIVGKSWDLHVREVLKAGLEENLLMISDTVSYLKTKRKKVFFDAEHFFDGYRENNSYALSSLKAASNAGADLIVLCDTNGGSFPDDITRAIKAVKEQIPDIKLGIHAHNDSGLAIANSIAAVKAGCVHVQGTIAGFGERCGNTALAALLPSLELKLGLEALPKGNLVLLSSLTRRVAEIANVLLCDNMPYVGSHAFSHKAGMHSDGVLKTRRSFEHIDPAAIGNDRHFLMSEAGGKAAIAERVKKFEPCITKEHPMAAALAAKLKEMEAKGWAFEGADASFELLVRKELASMEGRGKYKPLFQIEAYRVMNEHPANNALACSNAWVKVLVKDQHEIAAAEGEGPVNALDSALRKALIRFFPNLAKVRLEDYKVRVIDGNEATAARVRVLIKSTDGLKSWNTVGVSPDIIDASRSALVDSIEYKLISDMEAQG